MKPVCFLELKIFFDFRLNVYYRWPRIQTSEIRKVPTICKIDHASLKNGTLFTLIFVAFLHGDLFSGLKTFSSNFNDKIPHCEVWNSSACGIRLLVTNAEKHFQRKVSGKKL